MIAKLIQRHISLNIPKFTFGTAHHAPAPQKLQRAQDKLIYLYIKNIDNIYQKVPAYQGESLYETITRMRVRGFQSNTCDGYDTTYRPHYRPHDPFSDGPQCGGCRVILEDNWFNRVDRETDGITQKEISILEQTQTDLQSNTRLACCIPIEQWMNGMTLSIDPQPTEGSNTQLF